MRLKQLLSQYGINQTELARILGRDKSVVTNLFQGKRQLKADEVVLIAEHLGVAVAEIMGLQEKTIKGFMEKPLFIPFQHEPRHIKKRSDIVKKHGRYFLEVNDSSGYSEKNYALEVSDDSMSLAGILTGDIVISALDVSCKNGQTVIAQHYQGRGAKTVIRLYQEPHLLPHSMNASYKPLHVEHDQVRLVSPVIKLIRVF